MNKTFKTIAIIIVIIAVLAVAFYFLGNKEEKVDSKLVSSNSSVENGEEIITDTNKDTQFLGTLNYLKSMKIDTGIFMNSSFKSLKDNTVNIQSDGVVGRDNPFSSISGIQQSVSSNNIKDSVDNTNNLQ